MDHPVTRALFYSSSISGWFYRCSLVIYAALRVCWVFFSYVYSRINIRVAVISRDAVVNYNWAETCTEPTKTHGLSQGY